MYNALALFRRKVGFINLHAIDYKAKTISLPITGKHLEPKSKAIG